jgi:hypothetical protein
MSAAARPSSVNGLMGPGRVADCYLGLLLPPGPAGEPEAGTVLVAAPATPLHPGVPQPAGSLGYELLIGHREREPGELGVADDLTVELRAWPADTWAKVGVDPDQVARAVIGCWRDGEVTGPQGWSAGRAFPRCRRRMAFPVPRRPVHR